jgi:hypothetical protein
MKNNFCLDIEASHRERNAKYVQFLSRLIFALLLLCFLGWHSKVNAQILSIAPPLNVLVDESDVIIKGNVSSVITVDQNQEATISVEMVLKGDLQSPLVKINFHTQGISATPQFRYAFPVKGEVGIYFLKSYRDKLVFTDPLFSHLPVVEHQHLGGNLPVVTHSADVYETLSHELLAIASFTYPERTNGLNGSQDRVYMYSLSPGAMAIYQLGFLPHDKNSYDSKAIQFLQDHLAISDSNSQPIILASLLRLGQADVANAAVQYLLHHQDDLKMSRENILNKNVALIRNLIGSFSNLDEISDIPILEKLLSNKEVSDTIRVSVISAFSKMTNEAGIPAGDAIPYLIHALDDGNSAIRNIAIKGLSRITLIDFSGASGSQSPESTIPMWKQWWKNEGEATFTSQMQPESNLKG